MVIFQKFIFFSELKAVTVIVFIETYTVLTEAMSAIFLKVYFDLLL